MTDKQLEYLLEWSSKISDAVEDMREKLEEVDKQASLINSGVRKVYGERLRCPECSADEAEKLMHGIEEYNCQECGNDEVITGDRGDIYRHCSICSCLTIWQPVGKE